MSVPSSGRPSWETTDLDFGEGNQDCADAFRATRAASLGEMVSGMKARTQNEPSSSLGKNSVPSRPETTPGDQQQSQRAAQEQKPRPQRTVKRGR